MKRASDEIIQTQVAHFAESARKAIAGDVVLVIARFYDDEVGAPATMTAFSSVDEKPLHEDIARLAHMALSSTSSMIHHTGLELGYRLPGGEWTVFDVDDPHMATLKDPDG